jgi:hypothetical protein
MLPGLGRLDRGVGDRSISRLLVTHADPHQAACGWTLQKVGRMTFDDGTTMFAGATSAVSDGHDAETTVVRLLKVTAETELATPQA